MRDLEEEDPELLGAQCTQDVPLPRPQLFSQARQETSRAPGGPSDSGPWGCLARLLTSGSRHHTAGITQEEEGGSASPVGPGPRAEGGGGLGPCGVLGVESPGFKAH